MVHWNGAFFSGISTRNRIIVHSHDNTGFLFKLYTTPCVKLSWRYFPMNCTDVSGNRSFEKKTQEKPLACRTSHCTGATSSPTSTMPVETVAVLMFVLTAHLFVTLGTSIHVPCSTNCSCLLEDGRFTAADCSGRGLYSPPHDLPQTIATLDLSSNFISLWDVSFMSRLKNLLVLDLSDNTIEYVQGELSTGTSDSSLQELDPNHGGNSIQLPSAARNSHISTSKCLRLKVLLLRNNQIKVIGNNVFVGCIALQELDLSFNRLQHLQPDSFRGLRQLKSLTLRENYLGLRLEAYPPRVFVDLVQLESLNIKGNYKPDRSWSPLAVSNKTTGYRRTGWNTDSPTYPDQALSDLLSLKVLRMDALPQDVIPGLGFRALTNLTVLDFSRSGALTGLPENFFSNFSTRMSLQLSLSHCSLRFIHPDTFTHLPTLSNLTLAYNDGLEFSGFKIGSKGLQKTEIKYLDISGIHTDLSLITLQGDVFHYLKHVSLEELIIENNNIFLINKTVPSNLPKSIKRMSIGNNRNNDVEFFPGMLLFSHLEMFNMSVQNKYETTIHESRETHKNSSTIDQPDSKNSLFQSFQNTSHLLRSNTNQRSVRLVQDRINEIEAVSESVLSKLQNKFCPPDTVSVLKIHPANLTKRVYNLPKVMVSMLTSSKKQVVFVDAEKFFMDRVLLPVNLKQAYGSQMKLGLYVLGKEFQQSNKLEILDLSRNLLWCLRGPIIGLHRLKFLDLSGNYCIFLSPYFFKDMPSLRTLLLSVNVLGSSLERDIEGKTFSNLVSLEKLDLYNNSIKHLHTNAFSANKNLTHLLLGNNAMHSFDPELSELGKLTLLDISYNDIRTLTGSTLASLDLIASVNPRVTVDLSGNPLVCDCSTLPFLVWVRTTKVNLKNLETYRCEYINGLMIDLRDAADELLPTMYRLCYGQAIFTGTVVALLVLGVGLIYVAAYSFFATRLLFLRYVSRRRYFRTFMNPDRHGIRDVFLVFDTESLRWRHFVARVLKPALVARGVTCYISESDAVAGRPIRLVVEESVLAGKKTLVLITRNLFESDEREMEINMALLAEEMRATEVLMFMYLEAVPQAKIPEHLHRTLEERRAVVYYGGQEDFWGCLAAVLKS